MSTIPLQGVSEEVQGFGDLAEKTHFVGMPPSLPSLDVRSSEDLADVAWDHAVSIERERAIWEYCYRQTGGVGRFLIQLLSHEPDPEIRWNLPWLALKVDPEDAPAVIDAALSDEHREVRDWARLFLSEIEGMPFRSEYPDAVRVAGSPFDQTLPLQIAGFAIVAIPGGGQFKAVLSPLWFAHLQGRVMACTNERTFSSELIIEKCISGYHPDGSNHYEIYPFAGYSWPAAGGRVEHSYVTYSSHPFYLSGKVEEDPDEVAFVRAGAARKASTFAEIIPTIAVDRDGNEVMPLHDRRVVRGVRGQFFGWAHTSLTHYTRHGEVRPGTCQLANPCHDATRSLVNTHLFGTFRGKISDHDGDGRLDVNTIPCHGTPDGKLDYLADGSLTPDPYCTARDDR